MATPAVRTSGIISEFTIAGATSGLLAGTAFLAKDLFQVEGHVSSAGNPDWLKTHEPAQVTASAVRMLLECGATLTGKSLTDELAFSIDGVNVHYGIPVNGQYPDRIPGGSSSGSGSAVSTQIVDFALGTDTGGSVRVPASYCGIFGIRPSHGRVPSDGVIPLAPSLDTVGWFARNPQLLKKVGEVLLQEKSSGASVSQVFVASDLSDLIESPIALALSDGLKAIENLGTTLAEIELNPLGFSDFLTTYMFVQGREAWQCHGEWISKTKPHFSDDIRQRFEFASTVSQGQYEQATSFRERIIRQFAELLGKNCLLCLPTTGRLPPLVGAGSEEMQSHRRKTLSLTVLASLARLPQISIPIKLTQTTTTGLSFLAAHGEDMLLLDFAVQYFNSALSI